MKAADQNPSVTEENVITVDELVGPLSQEDQKQTYRSRPQISTEMVLTQCGIVQIIQRHFGLKWLVRLPTYIYISQGSAATQLRCGEMFRN